METSKRHLPFSGHEEPHEHKRKAVRFDEKINTAATSQSDSLPKISLKMPTMETRSQNPMPDSMQASSCLKPADPASSNSTDRTRNANGGDWQEELYQKIQAMKVLYLRDLDDMRQKILVKLQQHDSLPQQPMNEQLEELKVFKNTLERFMAFLQIPKQSILANYKDELDTFEKQIVYIVNLNRQIPGALQQHQSSLDSSDQTRNANGRDWKEELYQKIKAMKDLYLHDLNDMHQEILGKLQQDDSLPQQPTNEPLEKLKVFKNLLERFMAFLQTPKQSIMANYKDKLGTYEKQIINAINLNRRKPVGPQQQGQALPPQHMQSQQSHDNQMSSQMQTGNMHGSMGGVQQHSVSRLEGSSNTRQNMMKCSSLDSTYQTRSANGVDWQEEVYQKIKAMKDLYLYDLNDIHQKILVKLQQHDSLPQQPMNEQLEKLKVFKNLLEHFMAFLRIPKQSILADYKAKLGTYEKQIVNVINSNRRKPEGPQQH